ncbi:hypothetical protein [Pedobacter aquatilis]|uniref:hypothetical protein n=1 Tax=Pedobacter aquatilis TaxID=351343 RepID=UPI00292D26AA|nr:hypothetical protein [Pedobacter aquatilis]
MNRLLYFGFSYHVTLAADKEVALPTVEASISYNLPLRLIFGITNTKSLYIKVQILDGKYSFRDKADQHFSNLFVKEQKKSK